MAVPILAAIGIGAVVAVGGAGAITYSALEGDTAQVVRVIDGDTFDASLDGVVQRVRLLNIDTPETKDPRVPVECLGPEATEKLESLLQPGDEVTLTYDVERYDGYGRLLAGVDKDDALVNAEIARAGLGVAKEYPPNDRYYDEVLAAQREAEDRQTGLYSLDVECTVPGRVTDFEQSAISASPTTPEGMDAEAARLLGIADAGGSALLAWLDGPRTGPLWDAFTPDAQRSFRDRAAATVGSIQAKATAWSTRAAGTRAEVEAAQVAEKDRLEAEAREREEAAAAERRADAAARAQEQRVTAAARAEERRVATEAAAARRAAAAPSPSSGSSSGSYPGYTGPRCYAPGGKTWRPC